MCLKYVAIIKINKIKSFHAAIWLSHFNNLFMDFDLIVEQLIPLIRIFRENPNCELEGSLGVLSSNSFTSGVEFNYFKTLFQELSKSEKSTWTTFDDSQHFASFYFPGNIRGRYNVKEKPDFITKISLGKLDLSCPERSYDLRISVREEKPLCDFVAKHKPEFVRLHERWSFTYKNIWKYDFSKVAGGSSKETACRSAPTFEIELELLKLNTHSIKAKTDRELAYHILHKLIDLLGRFDRTHQPLPLTLAVDSKWILPKIAIGNI
jgi:hypothetical protein